MGRAHTLTGRRAKAAEKLLEQIGGVLNKLALPYILEAGTLLGIIREGRLLPWDTDIDFTLCFETNEQVYRLVSGLQKEGLRVRIRYYNQAMGPIKAGAIRVIKVGTYGLFKTKGYSLADIFVKYPHRGLYYWSVGDPKPVLKTCIDGYYNNRKSIQFKGFSYLVPLNTEDYLAYHYGQNWRTPVREWDFRHDDSCIHYKEGLPLYFVANSVYQLAYALPLYKQLGGTFVVPSIKKAWHAKRFLKNLRVGNPKGWRNTPPIRILKRSQWPTLRGVILFLSNSIDPQANYGNSITLFHEHGTSDKLYENGNAVAISKLKSYHSILLSGPKNKARIADIGCHIPDSQLFKSGCFRFDAYLNGAYDPLIEKKKLGIQDLNRPVVLYAPTWRFGDGTLSRLWKYFVDEITQHYSLIIRPHYHDRKYAYARYLWEQCKGTRHVYFSEPNNIAKHDTYAAFAASDLLISDMSSVLYEYTVTGKPIIVIRNGFKNRHRMPKEMDIMQHAHVYKMGAPILPMISNALLNANQNRQAMLRLLEHCFYKPHSGATEATTQYIQQLREGGTP